MSSSAAAPAVGTPAAYKWTDDAVESNLKPLDVQPGSIAPSGKSTSGGPDSPSSPDGEALASFKKAARALLREFFKGGDAQTAYNSLCRLGSPYFRYEVVKSTLSLALDGGNRERELGSQLLSALHGAKYLSMGAVGKGFERLYSTMDDLRLDVPDAEEALAKFTARAVVDDILPPAFLTDSRVVATGGDVIARARVLLSVKHAGIRMERVWGTNEANSAVSELKAAQAQIVAEYFDARDGAEAVRCVKGMDVPHLGHALVKKAFVKAWDSRQTMETVVELLSVLHKEGALSDAQLAAGLAYVQQDLGDLSLDAPAARTEFSRARELLVAAGLPVPGIPSS